MAATNSQNYSSLQNPLTGFDVNNCVNPVDSAKHGADPTGANDLVRGARCGQPGCVREESAHLHPGGHLLRVLTAMAADLCGQRSRRIVAGHSGAPDASKRRFNAAAGKIP